MTTFLTQVRTRLAVHAHRKVSGLLDGHYASMVTGRSLDFADLREYVAGDDVKDVDWKATARHGRPLVKRYVADRKHTVMLVVPTGAGLAALANPTESKAEVALTMGGLVGYLATRHGDYVGLYLSEGARAEVVRPSMRATEVERMLHRAAQRCAVDAPEVDLEALLSFVLASTRRRNIVVLVLDDVDLTGAEEALLTRMVVQHQVLLVTVGDLSPADPRVAGRGLVRLGSRLAVPTFAQADEPLAREIEAAAAERARRRAETCTRLGIAHVEVSSTDEVVGAGITLLERTRRAAR